MRTIVTVVVALSLAACTSGRGRGEYAEGPGPDGGVVAAPAPQAAPVAPRAPVGATLAPATGPMDAGALARETGMQVQDLGSSVLLSGSDVRARFFPGTDRVSIDGRSTPMGAVARREAGGLVVPAGGVDAVRRALRDAAAQRLAMQPIPLKMPVPQPVKPPPSLRDVTITPRPAAARRTPGGDPSWTAFSAAERPWKWIVIHHSDDTEGACEKYDRVHKAKGWDGCGYHFVIGNGTQSGDGEVEVGPRWRPQMHGAHAKTPDNRFNDYGIGVVLVGDFENVGRPTARQYESLVNLTRWLMARYGVTPDRVLRHSDCKSTACPGKLFPWAKFQADIGG
ncbi:MAG: peptidoglycan recognition family protein [Planctomycetota bacterium]